MQTRREVIKLLAAAAAGTGAIFGRLGRGLQAALAETKRLVLPRGTPMETLTGKNPATLDAGSLETTPLEEFGTMGQTNFSVAVENWRLEIEGAV
jgi:sulfoxide reductase catalytic subunit YedY